MRSEQTTLGKNPMPEAGKHGINRYPIGKAYGVGVGVLGGTFLQVWYSTKVGLAVGIGILLAGAIYETHIRTVNENGE